MNEITMEQIIDEVNEENRRQKAIKLFNKLKKRVEKIEKKLFFIPKDEEEYYYVSIDENSVFRSWFDESYSKARKNVLERNCFKTKEAAEKALAKAKEALAKVFQTCEH